MSGYVTSCRQLDAKLQALMKLMFPFPDWIGYPSAEQLHSVTLDSSTWGIAANG